MNVFSASSGVRVFWLARVDTEMRQSTHLKPGVMVRRSVGFSTRSTNGWYCDQPEAWSYSSFCGTTTPVEALAAFWR